MRLSDFDYELPQEAIARHPADRRDGARLLVVDRARGDVVHTTFRAIGEHLSGSDVLVVNDARVLKARVVAKKAGTGGRVEMLLVEPVGDRWRVMIGSSKPVRAGSTLLVGDLAVAVEDVEGEGFAIVKLPVSGEALAATSGTLPLPPYIDRPATAADDERYQTIFGRAGTERSVAAPTAGLHFTEALVDNLAGRGIPTVPLTLHVGPGTFLPVRVDDVDDHVMHAESFELSAEAAVRIEAAKRVVAVGTTATRVLETIGRPVRASSGKTELFVRPGFQFEVVGALVTNFHLPRSTLLMLVSAFAGRELILDVYRRAVREGYRFFSYGDAMLIL